MLKLFSRKQNNFILVTRKKPTPAESRRWICPFCKASLLNGTSEISEPSLATTICYDLERNQTQNS